MFDQAGFHGDTMGAVVGTLTMQTKQRRPSRGTSTLVREKKMERRQKSNRKAKVTEREEEREKNERENNQTQIWTNCSL